MVGIVIVSHSSKVAEGVKELALQMANNVPIASAGGTSDNELGTDLERIILAIKQVYSEDGVVILFDLGSACMNAQMAIESLTDEMQSNVKILDVALVEGAITIAVDSSIGKSLPQIEEAVKKLCLHKMS
ncbi:PTS-dependent dihydroxyacetone kinase phosphotransferase subunit DhaM [Clostridium estertheticum]|uniref:PTS-dependent dihydroxyacetone kinase phosphotransferase subunit DhaM n=1 Tax=Clostridium estertheticum TaxID=238834 RepID=A0AA47EHF5_9CLOT|nr:dihydroxyacetone kinase phosphoryl donor subunit DhaM [Clostridium estertheticum]MBU3154383.1 PTS-dependent dihydroxyacetone kinase phosphotransferase subunit DhaM [Clostridium estertheticum]MBU3197851.1 PTS-dependent dihydroxyacetone kinase phosphotransferase subunit DhaM [Clostridium estertheticum]WAG60271.1 PTS-dependent dihydroxyacetone kinase phosphotransferase subunit DhaM [Clostridium estertheticum]WAG65651.1 PTS-dependent dihydroxyacetone kinase phosphotransferase subunit DhaM [Clost